MIKSPPTSRISSTPWPCILKDAKTNSVVIVKKPSVTKFKLPKDTPNYIDQEECTKCRKCIGVGCLAIESKGMNGSTEIVINKDICTGCGLCSTVCKFDAIKSYN